MTEILKPLVFNDWLRTSEGHWVLKDTYARLAVSLPTKFELDREIRLEYQKYKKQLKEGRVSGQLY